MKVCVFRVVVPGVSGKAGREVGSLRCSLLLAKGRDAFRGGVSHQRDPCLGPWTCDLTSSLSARAFSMSQPGLRLAVSTSRPPEAFIAACNLPEVRYTSERGQQHRPLNRRVRRGRGEGDKRKARCSLIGPRVSCGGVFPEISGMNVSVRLCKRPDWNWDGWPGNAPWITARGLCRLSCVRFWNSLWGCWALMRIDLF